MEIRHLSHFVALAEEGQFTAAARRMNIVQSGLSATIKELEEELGTKLVNRTTRNFSLTKAGDLFLERARSTLTAFNDGIQAVRSYGHVVRGRLHLGILQSLEPYVDLPAVLGRFRKNYPEVEIAVRSLNTEAIPTQVRSGYVDLSFYEISAANVGTGLKTIPFKEDSLVAICSKEHPLCTQRSVDFDLLGKEMFVDLTRERALRKLLDRCFSGNKMKRSTAYEVSDVETMLHFVAGGLGIAIVPSRLARFAEQLRPLHVLSIKTSGAQLPKWRIAIVTRGRTSSKTPVDYFLETLAFMKSAQARAVTRNSNAITGATDA